VKGDVVILSFPFDDDFSQTKRRPAIVVAAPPGLSLVVAQITGQIHTDSFAISITSADFVSGSIHKDSYIRANRQFIPNYGDRWRNKERISTGFVESTVNQVISKRMLKKQQMRWLKRGAHLMLQIRTRVLNDEWGATLCGWYPGMKLTAEPMAA